MEGEKFNAENRYTEKWTVTEKNRDYGKTYVMHEMNAWDGEIWATRAVVAMSEAGVNIPEGILAAPSFEALATFGIHSLLKIKFETFRELEEELLNCVEIEIDGKPRPLYRNTSDCEEISTIVKLRFKVLQLHLKPFTSGIVSPSV